MSTRSEFGSPEGVSVEVHCLKVQRGTIKTVNTLHAQAYEYCYVMWTIAHFHDILEVPYFLDTYNNAFIPPPKLYQRLCEHHRIILRTLCTIYPIQSAKLIG